MLVLSRFRDEAITVGLNVRITVISIKGDKVRLAIEAPSDVEVHREEVYKKKFGNFPANPSNVAPSTDQPSGDDPGHYVQTR